MDNNRRRKGERIKTRTNGGSSRNETRTMDRRTRMEGSGGIFTRHSSNNIRHSFYVETMYSLPITSQPFTFTKYEP